MRAGMEDVVTTEQNGLWTEFFHGVDWTEPCLMGAASHTCAAGAGPVPLRPCTGPCPLRAPHTTALPAARVVTRRHNPAGTATLRTLVRIRCVCVRACAHAVCARVYVRVCARACHAPSAAGCRSSQPTLRKTCWPRARAVPGAAGIGLFHVVCTLVIWFARPYPKIHMAMFALLGECQPVGPGYGPRGHVLACRRARCAATPHCHTALPRAPPFPEPVRMAALLTPGHRAAPHHAQPAAGGIGLGAEHINEYAALHWQ